jgi:XTP/dITP diphosphohydrolase
MMKLVLATQNAGKIKELQELLGSQFEVCGLPDYLMQTDIPETCSTLEGNALEKAQYVFDRIGGVVVADDTGLEVRCLNGRPGVLSARYAGPAKDEEANMAKLLKELGGTEDRHARFRTAMTLVSNDHTFTVEGIAAGVIAEAASGEGGFGYDPVFIPSGSIKTFAEMSAREKNAISHRGKAVQKLVERIREVFPE